ncbi:hypothetical protein E4P40_03230 [Blastococcus sp. CT_GayMR20]|uniref:hypothetical protein n=1 Tax=Blastococcus sp. CT_GayMR20 TaxID=2559609 RepID=UPI0010741210|nr:hypothetical protein [Blastococcus sp. CT_GayMR20]TFV92230.1 hypothetical protein E4P40_03230 [Blastococcus sp. CT_GayMR20]
MRRTAIAFVVGAVAACGGPAAGPSSDASTSSSVTPAVPAVPGIEAEIVRLRTDEAIGGQVQVRLTDTGDTPFTVTSVALRSPGFAPVPPTAITAEYAPGRVIDLPVPFGDAVCDASPVPASAELTVTRPDGSVEPLEVPAEAQVLELVHAQECDVLGVTAVVAITVTDLEDGGDALTGSLTLTRREGAEPVTAARLGRSVLVEPTADLPLELDGDAEAASVPVSFTPASCDPHVLAETKKPYVFPLALTVGDDDEVVVNLPIDETLRARLTALVQRVCGPPS